MSDLEDVKEDLERICAEGDVLCCAALKCIRQLEAVKGVAVKPLARAMAETLNGGEFQNTEWYNGDQRELWEDRATKILETLAVTPAPVTVEEAARVLLRAMTTGDLIDERIVGLFYDCQPLAALRALAGQGGGA